MTFLLVGVKVKDFTKDFNNKDFIKDFTMDFTNFYGFVKKMVQKNQYSYNVPPGSSANPYGETRTLVFFLCHPFYATPKKFSNFYATPFYATPEIFIPPLLMPPLNFEKFMSPFLCQLKFFCVSKKN